MRIGPAGVLGRAAVRPQKNQGCGDPMGSGDLGCVDPMICGDMGCCDDGCSGGHASETEAS